ncbi:beta-galactosidase trimerization domain-containing protein [Paenibacillus sp. WQ 127069]|uniref:Beta-galactosidase trimerization domain-containing protein n=1 Tax=Paenibacillus baimaensis TaxID=2982185 RepID=A0ABT2UF14_9BACL|nr:beta-galactosidase trimerization domain-containing protein [Paenibacillus sp. WQ 127069]MCU6793192.1 beta-galactosidase trimerization domain-containing protein [Paenibacillus sp. WQ 127069]
MGKWDWLQERNRGIHMTIRDVDCIDFDAKRLAKDLHELDVNFLTFFSGGYVTTYPSQVSLQRRSPFLQDRDITGEIIEALHEYGIKALPSIEFGVMPIEAGFVHPEWCARDHEGNPYTVAETLYACCPLGGYHHELGELFVQEVLSRYDVDGLYWCGASYGFQAYGSGICYCDKCQADFLKTSGQTIPAIKDWSDPLWKPFLKWRMEKTTESAKRIYDMVKKINPEIPVLGNAVCFGDAGWTVNSSLDMEEIARYQDTVIIEAQSRVKINETTDHEDWHSLTWPDEETRYMTSISDNPVWVVVSYFLAWPWRRTAVPPVEQKIYLAQIAANGGTLQVNLSGGPPATHNDTRGFQAIKELYGFLKEHKAFYDHDRSSATIAIVFSQETLIHYGQDHGMEKYVQSIRGMEQALLDAHVPFDIISTRTLQTDKIDRYQTLLLPSLCCISEEEAESIRKFVNNGGGLVATHETTLYDETGNKRDDFLLGDLFQASSLGASGRVTGEFDHVLKQAYLRIVGEHEILEGIVGTDVVPLYGEYCPVRTVDADYQSPLKLSAPFRVFPEGFSYTLEDDAEYPMLIASEHNNKGRVVYFPNQVDKSYSKVGFPDLGTLIANAVRWTSHGREQLKVVAPDALVISLREKEQYRMVHMVNTLGGRRFFTSITPVRDVKVGISEAAPMKRAFLLSDGIELPITEDGLFKTVTIPEVTDYDVVVFEVSQ